MLPKSQTPVVFTQVCPLTTPGGGVVMVSGGVWMRVYACVYVV